VSATTNGGENRKTWGDILSPDRSKVLERSRQGARQEDDDGRGGGCPVHSPGKSVHPRVVRRQTMHARWAASCERPGRSNLSAGKEEEWKPSPPPPISRISIQVVLAGTLLGGTTQRAGDCMLGASLTFSPTIAPKTTTPTYTLELCRRRRQRRRRGRGRTEGLVETKEFAFGKCCWGGSALGQHRPALYAR
jgi:hypothetical protein